MASLPSCATTGRPLAVAHCNRVGPGWHSCPSGAASSRRHGAPCRGSRLRLAAAPPETERIEEAAPLPLPAAAEAAAVTSVAAAAASAQPAAGPAQPQPAAAAQAEVEEVEEFCQRHNLPGLGTLTIRPVRMEDVGSASVLLTRAFAGSLQGVPIHDARQYCLDCLTQPPRGLLLVARLQPTDPSLLPPGQASRLVATTGLSFCRETREDFPTLQPPDDAVYLSNMAVDTKLRRRGLARLMLAAAEALVAASPHAAPPAAPPASIYLHARLSDAPAQALYLSSGYTEVERDNALLVRLRGITPRALMQKSLRGA